MKVGATAILAKSSLHRVRKGGIKSSIKQRNNHYDTHLFIIHDTWIFTTRMEVQAISAGIKKCAKVFD
jgi:hypothetical protein